MAGSMVEVGTPDHETMPRERFLGLRWQRPSLGPDDTDPPAAGDRKFGDFDFFDLSPSGEGYAWALRAQYDTQRGVLTRVA